MSIPDILRQMEVASVCAASHIFSELEAGGNLEASKKADASVLTRLDLESQSILRSKLEIGIPIISEEDQSSHVLLNTEGFLISLDPLDGTSACKRFKNTVGGQVGFGPILGLYNNRRCLASCYYNVPTRTLFSAISGNGSYILEHDLRTCPPLPEIHTRRKLQINPQKDFSEAAVLFYPGVKGELRALEQLRRDHAVETAYRFGGFGNDCSRLAQDFEQASIQFLCKPWDFPALLLATEAGVVVRFPDLTKPGVWHTLETYQVLPENPMVTGHPALIDKLCAAVTETIR